MLFERRWIPDARRQYSDGRVFFRRDDANDLDILAVLNDLLHVFLILGLVGIEIVFTVILVALAHVHELELAAYEFLVIELQKLVFQFRVFSLGEFGDRILQLFIILHSERV